jgi:hypothetical protein
MSTTRTSWPAATCAVHPPRPCRRSRFRRSTGTRAATRPALGRRRRLKQNHLSGGVADGAIRQNECPAIQTDPRDASGLHIRLRHRDVVVQTRRPVQPTGSPANGRGGQRARPQFAHALGPAHRFGTGAGRSGLPTLTVTSTTSRWPMSMLAGDGAVYRERLMSLGLAIAPSREARPATPPGR